MFSNMLSKKPFIISMIIIGSLLLGSPLNSAYAQSEQPTPEDGEVPQEPTPLAEEPTQPETVLPEEPTPEPMPEPEDAPPPAPMPAGAPMLATESTKDITTSGIGRYVATTGTNTGDCTNNASPCATITYAISQAMYGDTIHIADGIYNEYLTINKDLTLSGASMNATILSGNGTSVSDNVVDINATKTVAINDLTIQNGYAWRGAGIYNLGTLDLQRVIIKQNACTSGGGGGIYSSGALSMQDVSVVDNTSENYGGGLLLDAGSGINTYLNSVTISGNQSASAGGGIWSNNVGPVYLNNVTVSGNSTLYGGDIGGIYAGHSSGYMKIINSTIVYNTDYGFSGPGTVEIKNSIVAFNYNFGTTYQNCICHLTSLGNNLYEDDGVWIWNSCGFNQPSDVSVVDNTVLLLGVLASNGGYTQTHALAQTSPAVEAGTNGGCPATDQRGMARPHDGDGDGTATCDIGAYEYIRPTPIVTIIADTPDPSLHKKPVTVSVTVSGGSTPTGTVNITGASSNCDITLSGGSGSCAVIWNTAGAKTITASYTGDSNYSLSQDTEAHTVNWNQITKTYNSVNTYDGWLLESSETSNKGGSLNASLATLSVGDDAQDRQYRGMLHFNTAPLPDNAVIQSVQLKVKRASFTGTNPLTTHSYLYVDMRKGAFSNNNALQAADWQAPASKLAAGKIPNKPVSNWYTMTLAKANFTYLNKLGVSQLRLRFNKDDNDDRAKDTINFFSGNCTTVANRPKLTVTYYVP